jgi:hypothetical protein
MNNPAVALQRQGLEVDLQPDSRCRRLRRWMVLAENLAKAADRIAGELVRFIVQSKCT